MMKAVLMAGVAMAAMIPTAVFAAPGSAPDKAGTTAAPGAVPPDEEGQPQSAPAAAPQTALSAPRSDDIIVTAQRRDESLQKVPVAVTVFTSENRDKLGIRSIQDMSNVTPGLSFNSTLDRLSLRGVGRLTNTIGSDPGVAVYNDGLYTSSNAEASKTPMFVDSIQILRGPQGTLFGRNSVGGAINVISKRPKDYFEGEFRLTGDEYGGLIAEGYLSGPITDKLKARVSVQMGPRPIREAFNNIGPADDKGSLRRFLVEGQLQYDFSDKVQLWFKYSHAEWDHENYGSANLVTPYATGTLFPDGALVPNPGFGYTVPNPGVTDPRTINTNTTDNDTLSKNQNFVVNFRADLGSDIQLKYVGGYSRYLYTLYTDLDQTAATKRTETLGSNFGAYTYNPTYIQQYIEDKKYYSNEVTLSNSRSDDRFNWVVGAYQFHEHYFQPVTWYEGGDGTDQMAAALANPICLNASFAPAATCPANPQRAFYRGTGDLTTDSYAGFGQVDYKITDQFKVTAGLRYSSDKKVGSETYRLVNWNPVGSAYCVFPPFGVIGFGGCGPTTAGQDITRYVLQLPGSGPAARNLSDTFTGWSWRLGADYQITPSTLIYASYNRGLKAGGFNLGSYAVNPEVKNEEVDAYEIGLKSRPIKDVTLNLTGFYYDYRNAQIPIFVALGNGSLGLTTQNFFNINKTRALGAEVEAHWNVTSQLELNGTYSYLDSTIRKAPQLFDDPNQPGNNPVSIVGNRTPAVSKHKFSVSALYDVPVGTSNLFLAVSYAYRSDAYYDVFESKTGRAPGWGQTDARITWVDPTQKLTLILYARNLFNTLGYDGAVGANGTSAAGYGETYSYTLPRQIGAEMHVKF
jgi:iron complex outermembrane receptor protein